MKIIPLADKKEFIAELAELHHAEWKHLNPSLTLEGRAEAITLNMSQQGARIECESIFAVGQRLTISCEGLPDIRCTVRWRRDANYGLVFEDTFTLREFALAAARVQCPALVEEDEAWPRIP